MKRCKKNEVIYLDYHKSSYKCFNAIFARVSQEKAGSCLIGIFYVMAIFKDALSTEIMTDLMNLT